MNFFHWFENDFRLAVTFAPSRASSKQTGNIFHRQNKSKIAESLFVMASHGVLLEYTLEPLPDVNTKDNICESSPIKLQVHLSWEYFGQDMWSLIAAVVTFIHSIDFECRWKPLVNGLWILQRPQTTSNLLWTKEIHLWIPCTLASNHLYPDILVEATTTSGCHKLRS